MEDNRERDREQADKDGDGCGIDAIAHRQKKSISAQRQMRCYVTQKTRGGWGRSEDKKRRSEPWACPRGLAGTCGVKERTREGAWGGVEEGWGWWRWLIGEIDGGVARQKNRAASVRWKLTAK